MIGSRCLMPWLLPMLLAGSCAHYQQKNNVPTNVSNVVVASEVSAPPLVEATLAGDGARVKRLLEGGSDPDVAYHTNTALIYAARDGFTEIARGLIDHGADVNWIDGEGVTPLILASFKNHRDIVQLLLDHGADITVRDQWHRTALDYALRRGTDDPIAQLLKAHR